MYLAKKLIYSKASRWINQDSYYPIYINIIAVMSLSLLLLLASYLKVLNVDERFNLDWKLVDKDAILKCLSRFLDLPAHSDLDVFVCFWSSRHQSVLVLSTYVMTLSPVDSKSWLLIQLSGLWKI